MANQDDILARLEAVEAELAEQKDILAIYDLMARYSRALDWLDDDMLETVFYDDAEIDYGFFKGSGKDFKPVVMEIEYGTPRRWHFTSQVKIDLHGDSADVDSYNLTLSLPAVEPAAGTPHAVYVGFYKDRLLKRGGKWGIIARKHLQWSGGTFPEIAMDGDMAMLNHLGMAEKTHPDYRRLSNAKPLDKP